MKDFDKLIEMARYYRGKGNWRVAKKITEAIYRNAPAEIRDDVRMLVREMPFKVRMDDKTLDMF